MTCSISQVGDREWWCSTHRRNAEDCETPPATVRGGNRPTPPATAAPTEAAS